MLKNPRKTGAPAAAKQSSAVPERELRQTILDTARALLNEKGAAELSMREVARRAAVTHQAPYHYFSDRESVLAELVTQGFVGLATRLASANDLAASKGKRAAVVASGQAYIGTALASPGVFRIMFRPDACDPMRFPEIQQAGGSAYAELERLVRIVHGERATTELASIYWAHVHGLACLMVDGPLAQQFPADKARLKHLRAVSEQFADLVESLR